MAMVEPAPFVPWDVFMARWRWHAGEHVTVIGPTGTGKSTLQRALLVKRYEAGGAVCVLGTKPADATLSRWQREDGLTRVDTWPPKWPGRWWERPSGDEWARRIMLWPKLQVPDDLYDSAGLFRDALVGMFLARHWCMVADELWWLVAELGLAHELKAWWSQGRSMGLTVLGATQRPVDIPLLAYNSATHLFLFADNDEANLARISGLGGLPNGQIRALVASLPFHDVLYVNTRRHVVLRTRVPV